MKVTVQEVWMAILDAEEGIRSGRFKNLSERIRTHGIAPPEGMALVPELRSDDSDYSVGWNDCVRWAIQNAAAPKQEND